MTPTEPMPHMKWSNVNLIFRRELRDQLRDRRTLFTVVIMPILLYPLLGMAMLQVAQFMREHPTKIWIMGSENLPTQPALLNGGEIADAWVDPKTAALIETEVLAEPPKELEKYIREFRNSGNEQARELVDQLIQKELKRRQYDAAVFITQSGWYFSITSNTSLRSVMSNEQNSKPETSSILFSPLAVAIKSNLSPFAHS